MIPIQKNCKQLAKFYLGATGAAWELKCVSTVSSLFQPICLPPKDATLKKDEPTSKSQKLFSEFGIVRQSSPGLFTLTPLGVRSLEKLVKIVDEELKNVGCQKLQLPILTAGNLWKKTGRWESTGLELLTIKDRHGRDYVLSPTHEEAITDLVAYLPQLTHKQLPLKLYQITSKFRDEIKPRFGLLRSREFTMKDLYTFDKTVETAQQTYELVCKAYDTIFQRLNTPFVKVAGSTGNIGGLSSHEYHFPSSIGEDDLRLCPFCHFGTNAELSPLDACTKCGSANMKATKGIEVAHTFLLGTKYSQVLNAFFSSDDGTRSVCQMGCYGIGISRILAASVEVLATDSEIRWPKIIAPYSVCVVAPKGGSKEESAIALAHFVASQIDQMKPFTQDVILDDRSTTTIGKKLMEAKRMGYPFIVVVGRKSMEQVPLVELYDLTKDTQNLFTVAQLFDYLKMSES